MKFLMCLKDLDSRLMDKAFNNLQDERICLILQEDGTRTNSGRDQRGCCSSPLVLKMTSTEESRSHHQMPIIEIHSGHTSRNQVDHASHTGHSHING